MKYTITYIITGIISLLSISVGYVLASEVLPYENFISDISRGTENTAPANKKTVKADVSNTIDMIQKFCIIYTSENKRYNEKVEYLYDPAQSLFMMLLCDPDNAKPYLQHTERKDYGIQCEATMGVPTGNNCSSGLHKNVDNFYNMIIGDLVDAMTAQAYGYPGAPITGEKVDIQEITYDYLSQFGTKRTGKDGLCDKNQRKSCEIPQTLSRLTSYIKKARQLIQKRKRLQQSFPKEQKVSCSKTSKIKGTYTILACGLQQQATIHDMHQLISNELIRYTTFINYYAYQLQYNARLQPHNTNNTNISHNLTQGAQQAQIMLQKHAAAVQATTNSLQHIAQINTTFPVHIHLLAYYEVTKKVRNKLAKIYTPLHQLYYKLRNVQAQG